MNLHPNTPPLSEADQAWLRAATRLSLTKEEMKVISFYLRRGYSLKEIARLFIEAQKTKAR